MRNRLLSVLMGIAICMSGYALPISAEENTENIYTFDTYVSETANAAVPEGWIEVNGYSNDPSYNRVEIFSKKGLFGKDSSDTAYKIAPYWNADPNPVSQWYQTRYNPNAAIGSSRYVKVSYEMAVNYIYANRWLQLQFADASGITADTPVLFRINKEDRSCSLYIDEEKSDYSVPAEKWMRFDIICDMTALTADLYVDGELKKTDVSLEFPQGFEPAVLKSYIYGVNALRNDAGTAMNQSETYFDNVSYMMSDNEPEITVYTAPDVIDFQDYESGTIPQGYNASTAAYEDFVKVNANDKQSFAAYDGLRGKAAEDRSLRIKADSGTSATGNNTQYAQYRWNVNMAVSGSETPYFLFSTEFAIEGAAMNRGITLQGYGSGATYDYNIIEIKTENGEQAVYVGGNKTDLQLPMSVLIKFDVVVNREERTFDLYINGEKKFADQNMNGLSYLEGINQVILISNQPWVFTNDQPTQVWQGRLVLWNGYVASDTYYDNMECGKYYKYPRISPYTSPSVSCMSKIVAEVNPIDGAQQFGHWVPLVGYDSEYFYYAQNVSMPADNAVRAYKATFGKLNDEAIVTDNDIFEVKNGNATAYGKEFGNIVPTGREFKLSFLFDIVNKTYNVYIDDEPVVVEMPFETNNAGQPVMELSNIELYVTAEGQTAYVNETPIASGAYIDIPKEALYDCYETDVTSTAASVKILSNSLSGVPILAVYDPATGELENVEIGENGDREISVEKAADGEVRFMMWDNISNMKSVTDAFDVK